MKKPGSLTRHPRVRVICANCGEGLDRHFYRVRDYPLQFCNLRCHAEWQSRNVRGEAHPRWVDKSPNVTCAQCRSPFYQRPEKVKRNEHHYCSTNCYDAWRSEHLRGVNNYHFTPKVPVRCANCGKTFEVIPSKAGTRKHGVNCCSIGCRAAWTGQLKSGPNNPRWLGGDLDYRGPNWRRQSREARKRDRYRCQNCGLKLPPKSDRLQVHHIKAFRDFGYIVGENDNYIQANDPTNLISLCRSCHTFAEWGAIDIQPRLL